MENLPEIGTLWVEGPLSYLEQLCLVSFRDAGHRVTLFHYGDVTGAPEGIALSDAREIMPAERILTHARTGSPAPHADRFRYRLLKAAPGIVWADTDAYCMRPLLLREGHLHGWESPRLVNNGVLALPEDSPALAALIAFTEDEFAIPPWFDAAERARLAALREAGAPVGAGEMSWGVWGPQALTHFLSESGEIRHSLPPRALYPISFAERRLILRRGGEAEARLAEDTLSIHLYGRRLRRRLVEAEGGLPKYWSLLGKLLRKHRIDPRAAPIPGAPAPSGRRWTRPAADSAGDAAQREAPRPTKPRPRAAGRPPRILIVTTMKNEGPFILEWIAHHRALGVTDFLVYTNDCDDGTDELHDALAAKGIVTHLANPYRDRPGMKPQHAAYADAWSRPETRAADWVAAMDVDEFVNIRAGAGRFADLFAAAPEATAFAMPWRLFGAGFRTRFEEGFVTEQFTLAAPEFCPKPHQAWGIKTLFRPSEWGRMGVHRPLDPDTSRVRWVDGSGRPMPPEFLSAGWRVDKRCWGYGLVALNHYALRSSESFLVKRARGRVNHVDRDQGVEYWFRMNHNAVEDRSIAARLPATRAEFDRLMADGAIRAAHEAAVAAHRAKIAALLERPDYRALFDEIESPRMRGLSRMLARFGNATFLKGPQAVPAHVAAEAEALEAEHA